MEYIEVECGHDGNDVDDELEESDKDLEMIDDQTNEGEIENQEGCDAEKREIEEADEQTEIEKYLQHLKEKEDQSRKKIERRLKNE